MPTRVKVISWTAENEKKLLYAIVTLHDIKPDYAKVAAIFGPDIPPSAISNHMSKLRKKAIASLGADVSITSNTGAKAPARGHASVKKTNGKGRKAAENENADLTDDEAMKSADASEHNAFTPAFGLSANRQKIISGRVTKNARSRKIAKKALEDTSATIGAADDKGELATPTERSKSEDAGASDGGYEGEMEEIIKTEDVRKRMPLCKQRRMTSR